MVGMHAAPARTGLTLGAHRRSTLVGRLRCWAAARAARRRAEERERLGWILEARRDRRRAELEPERIDHETFRFQPPWGRVF